MFFLFSYSSDYNFFSDSFAYRQNYYMYVCKYVFIYIYINHHRVIDMYLYIYMILKTGT